MDLWATDSRVKEGYQASVEERRARDKSSKSNNADSFFLQLLKLKRAIRFVVRCLVSAFRMGRASSSVLELKA